MSEASRIARKLKAARGAGNLYSHSALSTFRECPWRWFAQYALGLRDAPNAKLVYGHLVHAVASEAIRARNRGERAGGSDAAAGWIAQARRRYAAEERLVPPEQDGGIAADLQAVLQEIPEEAERVEVEGVVVQPVRVDGVDPGAIDVAAAEALLLSEADGSYLRVTDMLAAAGLNAIQVRVDAAIHLDGRIVIRDWKTNGRSGRRTLEHLVERYRPQVHLYGAVLRRRWPDRRIVCDLHAFRYGPPAAVETGKADLDDAARLAGRTMRAIAAAATAGPTGFGRDVGDACRYCHVARMKREDGAPACPDGAEERRRRRWDRYDAEDAEARIRAGIDWPGDDAFRPRPAVGLRSGGGAAPGDAGAIAMEGTAGGPVG